MKKLTKILICIVILSVLMSSFVFANEITDKKKPDFIKVGTYIEYGKYYNEPILWRVINIDENGNPLLFSEHIIDLMDFDNRDRSDWVVSSIREWLNDDKDGFLKDVNFTSLERNAIKYTYHQANLGDNNSGIIKPKIIKNSIDRVFLLSTVEIKEFFNEDPTSMIAKVTPVAVKNKIEEFTHLREDKYRGYYLRTPFSERRWNTVDEEYFNTTYWGEEGTYIAEKVEDGYFVIQYYDNLVSDVSPGSVWGEDYMTGTLNWSTAGHPSGIRPALYLDSSLVDSDNYSGDGTIDNPYHMSIFSKPESSYEYYESIKVDDVFNTIYQLEELRISENAISKSLLSDMTKELTDLYTSLKSSGKKATEVVYDILDRAERILKGVPESIEEVESAHKVIDSFRDTLAKGTYIKDINVEEKNVEKINLTDINTHWGSKYINNLVERGGISGYPDGTFKPNDTITRAEFISIAVKSALDGNVSSEKGSHWANGVFESAREYQVLLTNDFPISEWDKPITRYEMAYVMVRVAENILQEEITDATGIGNMISDYQEIKANEKYKHYVEQAFVKGLVTGKTDDGLYDGTSNGTRAEAATMVVRLLDINTRQEVETNNQIYSTEEAKQVLENMPTYNEKTNHGLIFGEKGYTLDDVAVFAEGFLLELWNYDATDIPSMDQWEKEVNKYVTTGSEKYIADYKEEFIETKDKAKTDVYVDASKIEIKDGIFFVNAVVYDHVTEKIFKVELRIGGHNVNKSEIAVGLWRFTEVK